MTRNEFTLLYTLKKHGLQSYRKLRELADVSTGFISQAMKEFAERGWVDEGGVTEKGMKALEPYRVDNAVIMAAGRSAMFVPLSLEKPKGLLVVKNEVLIERQIEQLLSAGIRQIVLVLGYKKEAFFYLEEKYQGIRIVVNPEYNTKHNTHTIYLASDYIRNTYICSSDDYFEENPFEEYVYGAYYAAVHVTEKTNEWYMIPDSKGNIAKVKKTGEEGYIMLGHAYWDARFSDSFLKLLAEDQQVGNYKDVLWEQVLADNVKALPPMEIRTYSPGIIFEFDSLEELRQFDQYYVNHTHSRIMKNITGILDCEERDVAQLKGLKEWGSGDSFQMEVRGRKYVYRQPEERAGAGMIWEREKIAQELAAHAGLDPTCVYMSREEGWRLSNLMDGARKPRYDSPEDCLRVIRKMRALHEKNLRVDWSFSPWEEAAILEKKLREDGDGIGDPEFEQIKAAVKKCYAMTESDDIGKRFCHCAAYADNWLLTENDTVLVNWEYAGNADPGCDVGTFIMGSTWTVEEAERFVRGYCGDAYSEKLRFHYLAYAAVMGYYWYLWALRREANGMVMDERLYYWRKAARKYSVNLIKSYEL